MYKPKHVSVSGVYTAHCPPVRTKNEKSRGKEAKSKRKCKEKGNTIHSMHLFCICNMLKQDAQSGQ